MATSKGIATNKFSLTNIFNIAMNWTSHLSFLFAVILSIGIHCGVSKEVEDCRGLPALWAGQSWNGHKVISGVARLQGIEGPVGHGGPYWYFRDKKKKTLDWRDNPDKKCLTRTLHQSVFSLRQKRSFCKRFYDGNGKFETEPNINRDWPIAGCTRIWIDVRFGEGTDPGTVPGTCGQHRPPLIVTPGVLTMNI
jgi:hypothetical protein